MTVINHKSISGITSITTPAGSDNLLTVHTNNQTERFRINSGGRVNIADSNQTGSHLDYTRLNVYGQTSHGGTNKNLNLLNVYNYGSGGVGDITGIGLGCGASPGGYTKASIGFIRTGSYGRGDLIFCVNSQGNGNQVVEGDERLRITKDGNVGINDTSPSSQLVVKATTDDNPAIQLYRQSTGGDIASINWQTSSGAQAKINYRGAAGANEGMQFYTAGGSSSQLRMIIDHSGRIGIGTNDPVGKYLTVGPLEETGTDRASLSIKTVSNSLNNGEAAIQIEEASGTEGYFLGVDSSGGLSFTNSGESYQTLYLGDDNKIGIGTNNPESLLHLYSASSPTIRLQDTTNDCKTLLFSQDSNAHLGTYSAHPLIFDTNSISRIIINSATGSNNAHIKFSTNDSSTDYLKWGSNPRLWLTCPDGINGLRIDANTTPLEIRNSAGDGRSIGVGGGANFDLSMSGDYSLSSSGHDSSPRLFLNATRHNGSTTVTSFQTSIQAVSLSNTSNDGYLGLGASASPDDINILTNGKVFIGPYGSGDDFSDAGTFLNLKNNTYGGRIGFSNNTASAEATLMEQFAYWGNNKVAGIIATGGGDTTNKDDGELRFYTRQSGQGAGMRVRITRHGATCFGVHDHANNALDTISGFSGTRNVNILSFPTSVSPWSSWVGTNLYHDGTNFVKHSDHTGQNWGNIAGIKFDGANHGAAIGMRFIVDLPQGNAGGDISIGSAVSAVNNKSAMNIYATGQITKPKHCSFHYNGNGTQNDLSTSATLTSWRNNGNQGYERGTKGDGTSYLSNGIFTAPVEGAYFFTSTVLLQGVTNSTDSVHIYWQKNGSGVFGYFNTRFHGETSQGSGMGYGGYVPCIGAINMYLDAGDTCRIKISYSGSGIDFYAPQNDGWSFWSGFLIG